MSSRYAKHIPFAPSISLDMSSGGSRSAPPFGAPPAPDEVTPEEATRLVAALAPGESIDVRLITPESETLVRVTKPKGA